MEVLEDVEGSEVAAVVVEGADSRVPEEVGVVVALVDVGADEEVGVAG